MLDSIIAYLMAEPLVIVAIVVALAVMIFGRAQTLLKLIGLAILVGAILYFVFSLAGTGTAKKEKLIRKSIPKISAPFQSIDAIR